MKTKNFRDYLAKRLDESEISEIETQAKMEHDFFASLQEDVANTVMDYMNRKKIGFNELARRLGMSPGQLSKVQKAEANLTLASLAHIYALLHTRPRIVAEKKSHYSTR